MKAIIVDILNDYAAALSDDGCIVKLKNKKYTLGQVIEMKKQTVRRRIAVWAASAAAIIMTCSISAFAYMSPYSYVSLDVNPSIEFTLNRFDRVIEIKAVNEDAEVIIEKIQLKNLSNKKIDQAIAQAVEQIYQEGYFDDDEGGIVISTSAKDLKKAEKLAEKLQKCVEEDLDENDEDEKEDAEDNDDADLEDADKEDEDEGEDDKGIKLEVISVGFERVQLAREKGVTPGKLNLVEKLKASAPDPDKIDIDEWLGCSVKEIMKATKEYKVQARAKVKAEANNSHEREDKYKEKIKDEKDSSSERSSSSSGSQELKDNKNDNKNKIKERINSKLQELREREKEQQKEQQKDKDKAQNNNGKNAEKNKSAKKSNK